MTLLRGTDGLPQHLLMQVIDISERKRFEGQLQYLADHDPLSGMFNRRRFLQELARESRLTRRYGTGGAVLALDLDNFKYVNDSLGHQVGDELITRTATVIASRLRGTDITGRLGGDEFAVILPRTTLEEAVGVAESLLSALRDAGPAASHAAVSRVTASIGLTMFGSEAEALTADELLVEADIALYDAKEAGRDRVAVYDAAKDRHKRMEARLTWADRIRRAVDEERFVLHAQPIQGLRGDQTPRSELLIRMIGENNDLIPPGTFLYIAERFDLIESIDRWVIHQAIGLLAGHRRAGRTHKLQVNLSAKSITNPDFAAYIAAELDAAGIDGRDLCVEITETAAIVNVDSAKRFAEELRALGGELALDDFGAGFASFYYLKHLTFDYVKIDGEFIKELTSSSINQLIVQAIVAIAKGIGKHTVAEFVGDDATLATLRRFGVDYAQGFHIGHPRPLPQELVGVS